MKIREIVRRETWKDRNCPRNAEGRTQVWMTCGHTNTYKASKAPKTRAFCRQCAKDQP